MPKPQKTDRPRPKNPGAGGSAKTKDPRRKSGDDPETSRSLSTRAERSLKDVDRLLAKNPETPPEERAMAQLDQAKVSALLELAAAIRKRNQR